MRYHISQTDPATLTTEALLEEIASFKALAVEVVERYSLILAELRKRRQAHAFMRHPVLSFFQAIADGDLHPEAALVLGNQSLIAAVLPLPPEKQVEIARGAEIPVATATPTGEIKSEDVPIYRMAPETLRRAFGPSGIRPVSEQADMIRAEGKIERHGAITVLRDEQALKIGNQKVRPEDLRGPLAALGYRLDLMRNEQDEPSANWRKSRARKAS
jgi:hypothetical protein